MMSPARLCHAAATPQRRDFTLKATYNITSRSHELDEMLEEKVSYTDPISGKVVERGSQDGSVQLRYTLGTGCKKAPPWEQQGWEIRQCHSPY